MLLDCSHSRERGLAAIVYGQITAHVNDSRGAAVFAGKVIGVRADRFQENNVKRDDSFSCAWSLV
jgi:hypothetical protein